MILDVIDEGYYYIVASSTYTDIILKLAEEYPENRFVIFDDSKDESEIPENVAFIFYAQNEGSYMVGQLAAGMTETGVVAVNVGMDNPVIGRLRNRICKRSSGLRSTRLRSSRLPLVPGPIRPR